MAALPPAAPARRLDLEGLRGIAVLMVVCFHAGLSLFKGAFVAVDVFFVLSGFFLTTTLAKRLATGEELGLSDLYARRVWRLLPALAIVVIATLLSSQIFYAPIDRAYVAQQAVPVSFFGSNIAFAITGVNYFHAGANPLLHTWTLGVEWQLALLLPALIGLLAAYGKQRARDQVSTAADEREVVLRTVFGGVVIVGALSFTTAVIVNEVAPMWAYFGPHTRLWAFSSGAAMAFFAGGGQSVVGATGFRVALAQLTGLAMLFVPAFFYSGTMAYPGLISLVPVGGALLLMGGGSRASETWVGRLLSRPRLSALGSVSFVWYLWHWPMMVLGGVLFPTIGPWGKIAFGFAALWPARWTARVLDGVVREKVMPGVRNGRPLLLATLTSGALVLISLVTMGASNRYVADSAHKQFADARNDYVRADCWANHEQRANGQGWGDDCVLGESASGTVVSVIGDSHAYHWLAALDRLGKARNWRVEPRVMGACPAANLNGLIDGDVARAFSACLRYREASIDAVVKQKPSLVILSHADHYMKGSFDSEFSDYLVSPETWAEANRWTYKKLASAGIRVVVLRDVPLVPFDVPSCLSRREANLLFAGDCTFTPNESFITQARLVQNLAAFGLDIRFVDMNDQVCPMSQCTTMRGGVVLYTDDDHITATFAESLSDVLGQRIDRAVAYGGKSKLENLVGKGADLWLWAQKYRWLIPVNVAPLRFSAEN
jgi:peptidoglycan/LPS O-acetylase OafA/YrhL